MAYPEDWCYLKKDPRIFTKLITRLGVKGAQVEELWTMDAGIFDYLRPIHGLLLIFKHEHQAEASIPVVTDERLHTIYFGKQVFEKVSGTQAIVNLLLNCDHPDVKLGINLTNFKQITMPFFPQLRGLALINSQVIWRAHNLMVQPALLEYDPSADSENYHFVGYMPINGRLYELNGLRDGPIDFGPIEPGQDWLQVIRPIILSRMNEDTRLMALISNRKMVYTRRINELIDHYNPNGMNADLIEYEIRHLQMLIQLEDDKMLRFREECAYGVEE